MPGLKSRTIRAKLKKALNGLGCRDRELSVLLTDDRRIAELNERYRGKKGPTNVLSFSMQEGEPAPSGQGMLGDVVVSVETAIEESKKTAEPYERTVDRLLAHGILHLLGYDHERSAQEARRMRREEKKVIAWMEEE
jgi:rRNA maturation RNase YbeY